MPVCAATSAFRHAAKRQSTCCSSGRGRVARFTVGPGALHTREMQIVPPEEVGLSSAALSRIDHHLTSRYIEPGKIAGALTLIARRGRVAFLSPLGRMDRERNKP